MGAIKYCERCGKEHDGSYGSGRFCSQSCANTRSFSEEEKKKIGLTVKATLKKRFQDGCKCEKCGKIFHSKGFFRKLCFDCQPMTIKHTKGEENPTSILDVSLRTVSKIIRRMELPCSCCGFFVKDVVFDIHHISPKSKGGTNNMDNLTYICPNCHRIAHTDLSLLVKPLVSLEQQLKECGKNWKDYYYG